MEGQRHLVEQAKNDKKNLTSELEALKRETLTLKRVKDQLFSEVQKLKIAPSGTDVSHHQVPATPPKPRVVKTESEIQTDPDPINGPELQKQVAHMKLRCEELQELAFEKEKTIGLQQEKLKSKDTEA